MKLTIFRSAVLMLALACGCSTAPAQDATESKKSGEKKFSAGLTINDSATADDVGLPHYPGATPRRDKKHDSDGVNIGFWGGSFGLKVVVVELETPDSPDKVADYYQAALAKYGEVLDCRKRTPAAENEGKNRKSRPLACDHERAGKKGWLFKAGTREKQRIASIQSRGQGASFQLIYIEKRGAD